MRVLMLSWEYPPRIIGGLGRHVYRLSTSLAAAGHDVHVVARDHPNAPAEEFSEGVHVLRVSEQPPVVPFDDLYPWVLGFNIALIQRATSLLLDTDVDIVHAHDWLVVHAAAALRQTFGLPLVATIHATEYGRNLGNLPTPVSRLIHQAEWWLTYEARRAITCSKYMRDQVLDLFRLPSDKIDVIPNGADLEAFLPRSRDRISREKLIVFAGRLEYEKGVHTLLEAVRLISARLPVRLVVAGTGTHEAALRQLAHRLGVADRVEFTGFLDDRRLIETYTEADLAVVPSLYEPFGLVALETMACGTPCIAADTGGLREIIDHEITGLTFTPGDAHSLAGTMHRLLTDERLGHRLTMEARRVLGQRFSWATIATRTADTYERARREEDELRRLQRPDERPPLRALLGSTPGGGVQSRRLPALPVDATPL